MAHLLEHVIEDGSEKYREGKELEKCVEKYEGEKVSKTMSE